MRNAHNIASLALITAAFLAFSGCRSDVSSSNNGEPLADAGADTRSGDADAGDDTGGDAGGDAAPDAQVSDGGDGGPGDGGRDTDTGSDAGSPDADQQPRDDLDPLVGQWSDRFSTPGMTGDLSAVVSVLLHDEATDHVYAGGVFSVAGTQKAQNVAKWNGFRWEPLGGGVGVDVEALARDVTGGLLAAGTPPQAGQLNEVFRFDGSQWTSFASVEPADSVVYDMQLLRNGDIIVAGDFQNIGNTSLANLARWTGSAWEPVDANMQPDGAVLDIVATQSGFCMAGEFEKVGDTVANHVACWDGDQWTQPGEGLPRGVFVLLPVGEGKLLAGGTFSLFEDDGTHVVGLAKFDGSSWKPHAGGVHGGRVTAVKSLHQAADGSVYVGGSFDAHGGQVWSKGIANLQGENWEELHRGIAETMRTYGGWAAGANAITSLSSGEIVVGGFFTEATDLFAVNIALWDGADWHPFVNSDSTYLGASGPIKDFAIGPDDALYVGGHFNHIGLTLTKGVAKLEGDRWISLGGGINGVIQAIAVDEHKVYAAGSFRNSGPQGLSWIAQWDGAEWTRLGYGLNDEVNDLAIGPNGRLYAVGMFTRAGNKYDVGHVAYWDGHAWYDMDGGLDREVEAITVADDGTIYVGGWFGATADGRVAKRLARWDGSRWVEVGGGTSGRVLDLDFYGGDLVAVGGFATAGGVTVNSVAVWNGTNFRALKDGLTRPSDGSPETIFAVAPKANGLFIAGGFKWADNGPARAVAWWDGAAWHPLEGGLPGGSAALLIHDYNLYAGGSFTSASGKPSYGIARWEYGE